VTTNTNRCPFDDGGWISPTKSKPHLEVVFSPFVLLTLGVAVVGQSEARSVAHCPTTLWFLSTLKLARNLAWASLINCSLCSSNSYWSSADRISIVGSMMLLGETSEWSLEPAIKGQSDRSSRLVSCGVGKKCVGTDLDANLCEVYQRRCSLWQRGRSAACGGSEVFSVPNRTVRVCVEAAAFAHNTWIWPPGRTPTGRRDPMVCLEIGRPHKTPSDDRIEARWRLRWRRLCYCLLYDTK
jgi:hypothetical protein